MFKNLSQAALGISGTQNELIELALSNGFRGLDFDVVEFSHQVEKQGMAHSRRLLDSAKLRIGSFALPVAWQVDDATFEQDLKKLPELAGIARDLGCQRATTTMLPASDERPYHQNFEFHRRRFGAIAAALEPFSIRLGVEFLAPAHHREGKSFEFIHKLDALVMLLGMVGKANVGLHVDLWHLHIAGGGVDSLRRLSAAQVVAVSLADAPADLAESCREEERLLPGESGVIDSAAALSVLAEIGYEGPVTPRPHPGRFSGQRRDQVVKLAGQSLDTVWKAAGLAASGKLAPAARK